MKGSFAGSEISHNCEKKKTTFSVLCFRCYGIEMQYSLQNQPGLLHSADKCGHSLERNNGKVRCSAQTPSLQLILEFPACLWAFSRGALGGVEGPAGLSSWRVCESPEASVIKECTNFFVRLIFGSCFQINSWFIKHYVHQS